MGSLCWSMVFISEDDGKMCIKMCLRSPFGSAMESENETYRQFFSLSIHEGNLDGNVTGRALTISKVQTLWTHIQKISTRSIKQCKQ